MPTATATKWIYDFAEGSRDMRELLGGKGADIAEMTRVLGPELVPAGFTITTEACVEYMRARPRGARRARATRSTRRWRASRSSAGKRLGDPDDPLLVSVRSGARDSMPGMMDTVLNLGLNDDVGRGAGARAPATPRFAWDSYRRLVQMFGDVVRGVPGRALRGGDRAHQARARGDARHRARRRRAARADRAASRRSTTSRPTRASSSTQAIHAVFDSWMGERAVAYRRINGIPDDWGTAVNVQQMVYGNKGPTSGSGVAFSRDEVTGAPEPSGDFLDRRAGRGRRLRRAHAARPVRAARLDARRPTPSCVEILRTLERHYGDMQDTEFTVEDGRLYMLQTRSAKRPAQAAVRFAVDAVDEGLLTQAEAIATIDAALAERAAAPDLRPRGATTRSSRAASPPRRARPRARSCSPRRTRSPRPRRGATSSSCARSPRPTTSPASTPRKGILTSEGGKASHAALVARGMGRPAVTGAGDAGGRPARRRGAHRRARAARGRPDRDRRHGRRRSRSTTSRSSRPSVDARFETVLGWCDELRTLGVRANADTPEDARRARELRRRGHRPVPDRAHVHGRRPPAEDAAR